ncbi:MAG TPA: SDR family oxidoreductase [Solirubrobacterales bacterium]|nr:SDR family oxidoreductase [Solirubrobacterales bacterium]
MEVASVEERAEVAAAAGRLSGKVALAPGAGQGLAQALPSASPPTAAGGEALVHHGDVSSAEDVAGLAEAVEAAYGRVDVLVNNAGVYPMRPFLEMDYSQWRKMFAINADSVFHLCRTFVPDDRIGTLTPGKQADLILLTIESYGMFPVNSPYGAVVSPTPGWARRSSSPAR